MTTQSLVGKDLACSFYVQGRHVMLVQGRKPSGSEVELKESGFRHGISNLTLTLNHPVDADSHSPCHTADLDRDHYYLVRPVFAPGPIRRCIRLVHRGGEELVVVRPLVCRRCQSVTGNSQSFCLDEAFEDALRQLPLFREANRDHHLPLIDIVAIGAIYGGFSGFSRLFLRLEADALTPPTDVVRNVTSERPYEPMATA
jgi:hypothetical protein